MIQHLLGLDGAVLLWIQEYMRSEFLTPIFLFITKLGNKGGIWLAASAVMLFFRPSRRAGLLSLAALFSVYVIDNVILKNLIARTRPYEVVAGLQLLTEKQADFSFPSGHTGSSFASAVTLYRELPKKFGIWAVVLACFIGFSRLYLGVHYPSDVIGGALIGSLIAVVIGKLFYRGNKSPWALPGK